jgi:BASS family bile acid:Na+ symporter
MDLKSLLLLAIQVSILTTVFGFGLRATAGDLLYVVRRPGLLARSLLAVFVIFPLLTLALEEMFNFPLAVEVLLVALAISPVPPLLPGKETKAGGNISFAIGLMAALALASIVAVPLVLEVLQWVFSRQLGISPAAIAALVLKSTLLPLVAGMAVRAVMPAIAQGIEKPVALIAKVLLPLALVILLAGSFSAMWAAIGNGTLLAMAIITVAGLAVGHLLGGPDPDHAVVLALSTACRHPAIALSIASANFPNLQFAPIILLYLIVNAIVGIPYLKWQQRPVGGAVPAA